MAIQFVSSPGRKVATAAAVGAIAGLVISRSQRTRLTFFKKIIKDPKSTPKQKAEARQAMKKILSKSKRKK